MPPSATSIFALPTHRGAKADPALVSADEQHFAAIADCLEAKVADLSSRLDERRRAPAGFGAQTIERDADIRRLTADLTTLRRFGMDVCIGHFVTTDVDDSSASADAGTGATPAPAEPVYVGRIGLIDEAGTPLLVDWRAPAAEPFFAATLADPMGVRYRRRYRWSGGRIVDFWDEVLDDDDEVTSRAALDDQSAFISSLAGARTGRMRDVLSTIQSDQNAIIRADARGALVVDGGPGTGKTVVALHRAAYLLHEDSRIGHRRGNLLLVGPHRPYLDYVADVLPALGEHSVQTATIADLAGTSDLIGGPAAAADHVPDGVDAEMDAEVARLKSTVEMVEAIETAVAFYEQPPEKSMVVQTEWADIRLTRADWAEAFASPEDSTPHNEAHPQIRETLMEILLDKTDGDVPAEHLRTELLSDPELHRALFRAWPMLRAEDLVGDLWTVPAYLRYCAPGLAVEDIRLLQRSDPAAWTSADLPLLDAARHRLGDADRVRSAQRRQAKRAAESERRQHTIDSAIAADIHGEGVMSMLLHADLQEALLDPSDDEDAGSADAGRMRGPYAHIIVDEAQELTDAQWRMILRRCPSESLTVVGDRAQARHDFAESWPERLERVGVSPGRISEVGLSINYRTPSEVMAVAAPEILSVRPDANVPTSVRSSGVPVEYGETADLRRIVDDWLAENAEGMVCMIGASDVPESERVRSHTAASAKGLEFDLVVLVDPGSFGNDVTGTDVTGAVDRYVAMTRATQHLVILSRSVKSRRDSGVPHSTDASRNATDCGGPTSSSDATP